MSRQSKLCDTSTQRRYWAPKWTEEIGSGINHCCITSISNVPAIDQRSHTPISDLPTINQWFCTVISIVLIVGQLSHAISNHMYRSAVTCVDQQSINHWSVVPCIDQWLLVHTQSKCSDVNGCGLTNHAHHINQLGRVLLPAAMEESQNSEAQKYNRRLNCSTQLVFLSLIRFPVPVGYIPVLNSRLQEVEVRLMYELNFCG